MLGAYPVAVSMPAVDFKRAKKFYTEVLGLKFNEMGPEDGGLFEAGNGTVIYMYQREGSKADHTQAIFQVDDIGKVVEGLTAKGVIFEQYDFGETKTDEQGIATMGPTKSAWFKDTEGNVLALVQT